jgi:hypothetical protein
VVKVLLDEVRRLDLIASQAAKLNEKQAEAVRYLQDQIEALTTLCNDLEEYTEHSRGCYVRNKVGGCNCGLLPILKRLNERMGL